MENRQRLAILGDCKKIIKRICPEITTKSGIYLFYRINEENEQCFYVGQAKNLLNRTAQHLMGRKQHLDKSIYVHKLYNAENPHGWKLKVLKICQPYEMDELEQKYIQYFLSKSQKCYNVAGGGQLDKAQDVGQRFEVKLKNYRSGKLYGYNKALEQVKVFFDKYLDFVIKGKPNKIKEKKFAEFTELLNQVTEKNTTETAETTETE